MSEISNKATVLRDPDVMVAYHVNVVMKNTRMIRCTNGRLHIKLLTRRLEGVTEERRCVIRLVSVTVRTNCILVSSFNLVSVDHIEITSM